jgi:hypothetical protein
MVSKPISPFSIGYFCKFLGLVALVSFDSIEWKFCFVGMNVVTG